MLWRRRSPLLVVLALAAPIAIPTIAFAQDRRRPARLERASAAAPASRAARRRRPPRPATRRPRRRALLPPLDRPPLITPAPASGAAGVVTPSLGGSREPRARRAGPCRPGPQRPDTGEIAAPGHEVFSEDWWGRVHPVVELHGYFRTRARAVPEPRARPALAASSRAPIRSTSAPIPLDQTLPERRTAPPAQVVQLCGPQRRAGLLRRDRVEREHAPAPRSRDPHLGQPAHP